MRRADQADRAAALAVWRASLAAAGRRPGTAAATATATLLAAPDALLVVADDGAEGVRGFALGRWVPPAEGREPGLLRLELLVVDPPARRAGLGSALAEALADAGWPKGARRLVATPADEVARAFLSACGLEAAAAGTPAAEMTAELEPPVQELVVRDGLRLGQLLKLAGLVGTGAEGKALLAEGGVQVDGEVEARRGRQLRDGEVVVARDRAVRVALLPQGPEAA